jgi:arylsulfatase A-like enzyme
MPTLCGLAGYAPDKDLKWDGRDVWPELSGMSGSPAAPRTLYWVGPGGRAAAVRHGDWKLIMQKDGKGPELFDLSADPGEKTDLAAARPARVAELKALLARVAERDGDARVWGNAPAGTE